MYLFDLIWNNDELLPGRLNGQAAKYLAGSRNIPLTRIHIMLIVPRCKQSDRHFVITFVTSYFITRLSEMSAALAVVAFGFMATFELEQKMSLPQKWTQLSILSTCRVEGERPQISIPDRANAI